MYWFVTNIFETIGAVVGSFAVIWIFAMIGAIAGFIIPIVFSVKEDIPRAIIYLLSVISGSVVGIVMSINHGVFSHAFQHVRRLWIY